MCVAEGKCSKWRSQCRWFILIYQVKGTPCTHANIFQVMVISTASLSFTWSCNSDLTESVQSQRLMIEFLSITECVWQHFAHRNRNRLLTAFFLYFVFPFWVSAKLVLADWRSAVMRILSNELCPWTQRHGGKAHGKGCGEPSPCKAMAAIQYFCWHL